MNLLVVANYGTPNSGNFIGSLIELGLFMKKQGDEVYFMFPMNTNTISENSWVKWLEKKGFRVYLVDLTKTSNELLVFLLGIIEEKKIDILHIHFGLFHNFAMHERLKLPVKILVHEHMEYPVGCNRLIQTALYILRSIRYRMNNISVVCVNKSVSDALLFCKHWYIPNGISFMRNIDASIEREERRKQLGFADNDRVVLFLGWDVRRKGLDIAAKAVQECRKKDKNIKLAVVGLGMPPKEERLQFIESSTGINPNEDWIYYLHSTEDMFSYHRAVEIYLSASRSEAFSYGLLEAISQDKPVVVSNINGTSWSHEYSRSYTYQVEDYRECSEMIIKAIEDIDDNMQSNYMSIIRKYSIQNWISAMMQVYNNIME